MARHRRHLTLTAVALAAFAAAAFAQEVKDSPTASEAAKSDEDAKPVEAPKAERPASRRGGTMLRVQIVLTRFDGDKKIASLPYTFTVTADGRSARMRMGVETPIPVAQFSSGDTKPMSSYQYRNVGTNLDCLAREVGEGRYQLQLSIENSSILTAGAGGAIGAHGAAIVRDGMPVFRSFNAGLDPVLRDGQSIQTVASTDPVSGEVMKIDVTLNVVR